MKAYKLNWEKVDWGTYHAIGFNYTTDCGVVYGMTEEIVRKNCPIGEREGFITIKEIQIEEE